ncbi:MAG: FKBP-type peptidyl-prolyl cis-trans isomerase [Cyanobacteria bacterium J06639_1]
MLELNFEYERDRTTFVGRVKVVIGLRYQRKILAGVLALAALSSCGTSNEMAIAPVSSRNTAVETSGESVSLIFQGNASQMTLVDAALVQIYASLDSQTLEDFFNEEEARELAFRNLAVASSRLSGGEFVIDPKTMAFLQAEVDVSAPESIDTLDVAVVLAALNLPKNERNADNLAAVAGVLLGDADAIEANEIDAVKIGVFSAEPPIITTNSGLQYRDWVVGNGTTPRPGQDSVRIDYIGRLSDENGTVFDSSYSNNTQLERGRDDQLLLREPFEYCPGVGQVIQGWEEGIPGIGVGGKRSLTIPPDLAYGDRGRPNIPPNSTLYFEVVLREINSLPPDITCSEFNALSSDAKEALRNR